jgi:TolA-binding protein
MNSHPKASRSALVSFLGFIVLLAGAIMFSGCQGSEEAYEAEAAPAPADTTAKVDTAAAVAAVTPAEPSESEKLQAQLRREMDDLKAENIALKTKMAAAEKKSKDLMAKVSDLEAAQAASQEQAVRPVPAVPARKSFAEKSTKSQIAQYEKAVTLAKMNKFQASITKMQSLLDGGIGVDFAGHCYYWMGLCYFSLHDYKAAIEQFREVLALQTSSKKDAAHLMLGKTYRKSGHMEEAKAEFKRLIEEYPHSKYAAEARGYTK